MIVIARKGLCFIFLLSHFSLRPIAKLTSKNLFVLYYFNDQFVKMPGPLYSFLKNNGLSGILLDFTKSFMTTFNSGKNGYSILPIV